jgi:nucleotidyltransferase/DNA polymerase involved in DNA repair
MSWKRVIMHLDMDAFFAAVEQLHHPEWRNKPVIIGADPKNGKGRGVVSTASYEARKYGVHSAMPISRAWQLCPNGIYVKPDFNRYSEYSRRIFGILENYTPKIQKISVDEGFLDVSGHPDFKGKLPTTGQVRQLAEKIKAEIFRQTRLTASVGVAASKSVAKIASDFQKPDGLTIVEPGTETDFLDPLPVQRIWGVGKKTLITLQKMGIYTIADLRQYPLATLEKKFGKMGAHLHRMANGLDEREVHDRDPVKSVSHETTFFEDQTDRELLLSTLLKLSEQVSTRLRKQHLRGKTVQLKLRYSDFTTFTRARTLPQPTCLSGEIYDVAVKLFEEFNNGRAVRLIGVGVSHLQSDAETQLTLWDEDKKRIEKLENLMDSLQEKYGKNVITHAQTLAAKPKKTPPAPENH